MKLSAAFRTVVSFSLFLVSSTYAQTYSTCNPLQGSCPADPALGTTSEVSFTSASSDYTETGNSVSYGSGGAQLTVSASGDNPTLTSQWYIMFGKVDFVFKSAPGTGMVSSAILLSDDLDEIDWELLGADSSQAQSNYFGKGVTGAYGRGGFSSIPSSQTDYNTYTIDWNAERILWQINGATMRTLTYEEAAGQYPQTPMQVKIGAWAGGDPSNAEGTIEWAGGPIDYSAGPYSMYVQSVNVQDYSTGSEYKYDGSSGSWQSITAVGGTVGSSGAGSSSGSGSGSSGTGYTAPTVTFTGTHQTSAAVVHSGYPWVTSSVPEASSSAGPPASSYLATLGYSSGSAPAVIPKPTSTRSRSRSQPAASAAAGGGCETIPASESDELPSRECTGAVRTAVQPLITAKPIGRPQSNIAIANAHSSQAVSDTTFYQGTEGQGNSFANSAGRTGAGLALFGLITTVLALAL